MLSTFECDCITSSLFLTSVAPNLLVAKLAKDVTGLDITWGTYALATILPGIIALIITPYLVYKLATPELTQTPEAPQLAKDELQKMGPMSSAETTVLIAFLAALAMWATTSFTGLNATMIALVCIGFMLVRGALEWNDIITEKGAWDTLVWMGGLMSLATGLAKLGFVKWIATGISGSLKGIDPMTTLLILCLINMYVHYAFASLSAHVSAVYAAFLAVAVAAGAPPMLSAIALGVETGIMGCLTHYATGPAPIYFGSGYITQPEWWKVGFVCSILFLICFLGIGPMWWKMVGLW
jgi:DASS family divalent anion:Na+ symporter